jgi:peptidoglycan/xylan/chitin deacetylase (PgdA/CDA1 family)
VRRALAALIGLACWVGACVAPQPGAKSWAGEQTQPPATQTATAPARHCTWPNGAQAAVSLTYDDALASQLRYAVPVLDRAGLKATFFLSGGGIPEFAVLAKTGHELASHTVKHPCNADLAALSLSEMGSELDAGIAAVQALGATGRLSFAYPCGQIRLKNQDSYVPLVKERFRAARGVAGVVADPQNVDLYNVPALFPPQSSDGSDVIAFIERAQQSHGWAVIGVHGVSDAGEYLQLAQPAHDKIIAFLAEHQQEIWTAPFGTVAEHIAGCK